MMTNNTNKKILICVETNSKARTDLQYVDIALKDYYKIPNDIKISYLPMGSKSKYNDKGVVKKIKEEIKHFNDYRIVYCIDSDNINSNPEDISLNSKITIYCSKNNINLVWFCKDIEEVFLHEKVSDKEKVKMAKKFTYDKSICKSTVSSLSRENPTDQTSNFLLIFDKLLERK